MPRKRYKPEEIVAKLRQVVLVSQGQVMADAIHQIGVIDLICLASCKHLSGVTRWIGRSMGNPLAHASIAGRPRGPR